MIEVQRKRVERAIAQMIESLYNSHLRKMQSDMHACAKSCCDDPRGSLDSVQNCIEECALPLIRAQDYMAQELGEFQGRLQHCVMKCNEDARDHMAGPPQPSELSKYQTQFENCTIKCVDKHMALIPDMMKTIKAVLARGPMQKA